MLGLTLSDGYLKNNFKFNSISKKLAKNVYDILSKKGCNPRIYIHDRSKWNWHDLHMVSLNVKDSKKILKDFDKTIFELGSNQTFHDLKYEWPRRDLNAGPLSGSNDPHDV